MGLGGGRLTGGLVSVLTCVEGSQPSRVTPVLLTLGGGDQYRDVSGGELGGERRQLLAGSGEDLVDGGLPRGAQPQVLARPRSVDVYFSWKKASNAWPESSVTNSV